MTKNKKIKMGLYIIVAITVLTVMIVSLSATLSQRKLSANIFSNLPKNPIFWDNENR
ncbi:MAG: hypothetical protein PHP74_00020 [Candidatus Gracilibacteria bacterium]|nr:hypothetical protein [Candidatus Gracilibacteria bacterium]